MAKLCSVFFIIITILSGYAHATPSDKQISAPLRSRLGVPIPKSCVIKAQAIVGSAAMSGNDTAESQSFVSVLSASGSMISVDFVLTPELVQQGARSTELDIKNPSFKLGSISGGLGQSGLTKISIKGFLSTMQMNLMNASGATKSKMQVYNTLGEAMMASSSVSAKMFQVNSNQASIVFDVSASDIKSLYSEMAIRSDLKSTAILDIGSAGGLITDETTGLPYVMTHAITLADIINTINVRAIVTYQGNSLKVATPQVEIGC